MNDKYTVYIRTDEAVLKGVISEVQYKEITGEA
nr:MAG TPA: hypothetical protein [Caudoviricetes sp.]